MAGPKIVKSNCPECGARVQVNPDADEFRCEYCGTVARIENKKKKDQPPPPRPQAGVPVQPVIRVSSGVGWSWLIYVLVAVFMTFGIGGFSMWRACGSISDSFGGLGPVSGPGSGGTVGQSFTEHMQWVGHKQPMIADANRDGVMDVIGWVRFLNTTGGKTLDHLAAFNAATGDRLWTTSAITDSGQQHQVKSALSGDKLVVADATGILKAYSIYNGQQMWTAPLGERAERICGEGQGFIRVETKDKRVLKVALATGQITPAGKVDDGATCAGVQSPDMLGGPYFTSGGGTWGEGGIRNPELEGMDVEKVLHDNGTGARVALGSRKPGTRIPTVALYTEDAPKKKKRRWHDRSVKGTVKWLANVPAVNPLTVKEGGVETGAISQGRIIVPYDMQNSEQGVRLSCINLNTGANLWDVAIPRSGTGGIGGINVSDRQVFVGHWTYLDVFELATGKHLMTVGVW